MTGSPRYQAERAPGTLKDAVSQLVLANGGQGAAASLTRVGRAQMARYTDDSGENETVHMPVDVVRLLESHCGQLIVTRYLAIEGNAILVSLLGEGAAPYATLLSEIGKETGDMYAAACKGLADGKLDKREAGEIKREALAMCAALSTLITDLDKVIEGVAP